MMERLSLNDFTAAANRSLSGDVRIAKGTEGVLVNKGTFGNRLASAFQAAGRAIGLLRPDPTRAQRQEVALERFKAALTDRYGEAAADHALRKTELAADGAALTGAKILDAISVAKGGQNVNRALIAISSLHYSAPFSSGQPSEKFAALLEEVSPGRDVNSMSIEARRSFNSRLNKALYQQSQYCKKPVDEAEARQVAKKTLKHVLKLESKGRLAQAAQARNDYRDAMKSIVQGLAEGVSVRELGSRFAIANQRYEQLLNAEDYTDPGADEFQDITMQALIEARSKLQADSPKVPGQAQSKALAPDGALRALVRTTDEALADVGTTAKMGRELSRTTRLAVTVAVGLGQLLSARFGTTSRDVDQLLVDSPLSATARRGPRVA